MIRLLAIFFLSSILSPSAFATTRGIVEGVWAENNAIYVDTTSASKGIRTGGSVQVGGPTPWADVKYYGAKGDGKTDDTAAIQSALSGGGRIFFSSGTYLISSTLKISTDGQVIEGESRANTIIELANDTTAFNLNANFLEIRDLQLKGVAVDTNSVSSGIAFTNCTRSRIVNTYITGFGYGIRMQGATLGFGATILDNYIYGNKVAGVYGLGNNSKVIGGEIANSPFGVFQGQFSGFSINKNYAQAIGDGTSIFGTVIESIAPKVGVGGAAVYVNNVSGGSVINVTNDYFEAVSTAIVLGEAFQNDGVTPQTTPMFGAMISNNFMTGSGNNVFLEIGFAESITVMGNYLTCNGGNCTLIDVSSSSINSQYISSINNRISSGNNFYSPSGSIIGPETEIYPTTAQTANIFDVQIPNNVGSTTTVSGFSINNVHTAAFVMYTSENARFDGKVLMNTAIPIGELHISSGSVYIDGTGTPTNSEALCLVGGQLGHCTSGVGALGGCTCSAP